MNREVERAKDSQGTLMFSSTVEKRREGEKKASEHTDKERPVRWEVSQVRVTSPRPRPNYFKNVHVASYAPVAKSTEGRTLALGRSNFSQSLKSIGIT